jgi:outer membrane scaffolding protein for murein synthesis (MipA/OmpV family)
MRNQYTFTARTLRHCLCAIVLTGMLFGVPLTEAQQLPVRHWSLWLGGGGLMEPVYPGSDALYASPVPFAQAEYTLGFVDLFAGMTDGIGVRLKEPEFAGLSVSLAVNPLGNKRDPKLKNVEKFMLTDVDEVKDVLQDTPKVTNVVEVFGTVEVEVLPFATLSSTVSYLPTKADYASYSDKTYDGITASVDVEAGLPLTPQIFLQGDAGVTWMNDDYAEAFHGVAYPTPKLKRFTAKNGVSDVHGSLTLVSFFSEHIGALAFGGGTLLLGDAADSPLTKDAFQPQVGIMAFYNF